MIAAALAALMHVLTGEPVTVLIDIDEWDSAYAKPCIHHDWRVTCGGATIESPPVLCASIARPDRCAPKGELAWSINSKFTEHDVWCLTSPLYRDPHEPKD